MDSFDCCECFGDVSEIFFSFADFCLDASHDVRFTVEQREVFSYLAKFIAWVM